MNAPPTFDASRDEIAAAEAYEELHVPALFRQWAPRVCDAADVRSGQRVLDVACGTGVLAREALARVGDAGAVTGVDPAPGMLSVAARLAPDVRWKQGSAESLPAEDAAFDAVVSQFGLMFFGDRAGALREMLRVLVPGGRVAVAVWDSLERSEAYAEEVALLERIAGGAAADALRAPFALGSAEAVAELFTEAGAEGVEVVTSSGTGCFPSLRAMVEADLRGWLPVMGVHLAEDVIARILDEARQALASYVRPDGSVVFRSPAHVVAGARAR